MVEGLYEILQISNIELSFDINHSNIERTKSVGYVGGFNITSYN